VIPITPIAECIDLRSDGSMLAKFGYQSNSTETVKIPIGEKNKFTPGKEDVGQPIEFFTGRVSNVVSVTIPAGESLRWMLGNGFVDANITTTRCEGGNVDDCVINNNKDTLAKLDNEASILRRIAKRIANRVLVLNTSTRNKRKAQAYILSAENLYLKQWTDIWGSFPQVSKNCPSCRQIDKEGDISDLIARSETQLELVNKAAALLESADTAGKALPTENLVDWAGRVQTKFVTNAQTLPRFESSCQ
jgi:hypothetical protein